jgi:hypothetical protein
MKILRKQIRTLFFSIDGKKEVLNTFRIKVFGVSLFFIFTATEFFWPKDETSLTNSNTQFVTSINSSQKLGNSKSQRAREIIEEHQADYEAQRRSMKGQRNMPLVPANVNLNAKQVITRTGLPGTMPPLPSGTNFIGELLNGIDTRNQNQVIKVLLPYGARHKSGGFIPKNTILLGQVNYSGQGEKVFITFDRAIFSNGKEYKISAQGLGSKDYSPGLIGDFHGNADLRIAAAMGLTMVSAASNVMITKKTIGGINENGQTTVVPEATMENAMLNGLSKVSQQEATRQAQELEQKEEYLTVDAGSDLIISLFTPFIGERF